MKWLRTEAPNRRDLGKFDSACPASPFGLLRSRLAPLGSLPARCRRLSRRLRLNLKCSSVRPLHLMETLRAFLIQRHVLPSLWDWLTFWAPPTVKTVGYCL